MLANIGCMLPAFADYSQLPYKKDDVIAILRTSDDSTLSPSIAQEIMSDGSVAQRMSFTGHGGALSIAIRSARMDFSLAAAMEVVWFAEMLEA